MQRKERKSRRFPHSPRQADPSGAISCPWGQTHWKLPSVLTHSPPRHSRGFLSHSSMSDTQYKYLISIFTPIVPPHQYTLSLKGHIKSSSILNICAVVEQRPKSQPKHRSFVPFRLFSVSLLAELVPNCILAHIISSLPLIALVQPNEDSWWAAANKTMTTAPFYVYSLSHEFNQKPGTEIECFYRWLLIMTCSCT